MINIRTRKSNRNQARVTCAQGWVKPYYSTNARKGKIRYRDKKYTTAKVKQSLDRFNKWKGVHDKWSLKDMPIKLLSKPSKFQTKVGN